MGSKLRYLASTESLSQKKIKIIKSELKKLSADRTDVFKCNIIHRYIDNPVYSNFAFLKNCSLVQFSSYYYDKSISENDYQTDLFEEDISDKDFDFPIGLPNKITFKLCMK